MFEDKTKKEQKMEEKKKKENDQGELIEKPAGTEKKKTPGMHVMPEEFLGAPLETKPKEVVKTVVVEKEAPPPPPPPPEPKKEPSKPPEKKGLAWWKKLLIILVALVILGGVGYFVFTRFGPVSGPAPEPEPEPEPEAECRDSDAGENFEERGIASKGDNTERDYCTDGAVLREFYCADNQIESTDHTCEFGCQNGECLAEPVEPVEPRTGPDTDSDGLSDVEEEMLYETDVRDPDSDNDEFLDGNEVFHLYNPVGTAPVTLREAGLVERLEREGYSYSLLYPSAWTPTTGEENQSVYFNVDSGEVIQVLRQEKEEGQSLPEWYTEQSPEVDVNELDTVTTKNGYEGIRSPDDLTVYLEMDGTVYVISYNLGAKTTVDYRQTFEMMINSFKANQP